MAVVLTKRWVGVGVVLAVGWLPVAPPEHVHEAEDHGHHRLLVHSHPEAHHVTHHTTEHDGALDEDDAPILTLDVVCAMPLASFVAGFPPVALIAFIETPDRKVASMSPDYVGRPIHGPPRAPTGLRAPPSISCL